MAYSLTKTGTGVRRDADNAFIPSDPDNSDWQAYLVWASAPGNAAAPYVPQPPSSSDVDAERERRLALGFNYAFPDARGTHRIGTSEKDLKGWDEVSKVASAAINTGSPGFTINIVTNTGPCTITALEWQQVLLSAGQFRQPIWQAFFGLVSSSPIPADYAADYHWPPVV